MAVRHFARQAVVLLTPVFFSGRHDSGVNPQQKIQIDGWVYDAGGSPLPGVNVAAFQEGVPSSRPADTGPDGRYELSLDSGRTVSKIEYTRSDRDLEVVAHLSGSRDHRISKILYRPGEPRSVVATEETLDSYEHALLFALAAPFRARPAILAEFQAREYAPKLARLPLPTGIEESARQFLRRRHEQLIGDYSAILSSLR